MIPGSAIRQILHFGLKLPVSSTRRPARPLPLAWPVVDGVRPGGELLPE